MKNKNLKYYIIFSILLCMSLFSFSYACLPFFNSFNIKNNNNKVKTSLSQEWYKTWENGTNNEIAYGIDVYNTLGDIYIAGSQKAGAENIALLKYNVSGALQWSEIWDNGSVDIGYGVAINQSSGDIYLTGVSQIGSNMQLCLLKYSSEGVQKWNKTWGGSANECGRGVALDSKGYILFNKLNIEDLRQESGVFRF